MQTNTQIDHYMVDFADAAGGTHFANATPILDLSKAKVLARVTSRNNKATMSAYVVAFDKDGKGLGHIGYFDGRESDRDGVLDAKAVQS